MNGPDYIDGPIWQHKKRNSVIMAGIREYREARFFEVREWAERDGQLIATQKGATFPPDAVMELSDALNDWLAAQAQPATAA